MSDRALAAEQQRDRQIAHAAALEAELREVKKDRDYWREQALDAVERLTRARVALGQGEHDE